MRYKRPFTFLPSPEDTAGLETPMDILRLESQLISTFHLVDDFLITADELGIQSRFHMYMREVVWYRWIEGYTVASEKAKKFYG